MTPIAIIATGALSSMGAGRSAYSVGEVGQAVQTRVGEVEWLREAGLRRPRAALIAEPFLTTRDARLRDPATQILGCVIAALSAELDSARPGWKHERVGICLGTSSGGLASQQEAFAMIERGVAVPRELAQRATYFGPLRGLRANLEIGPGPTVQVLGACASSTFAIGLACRWLELGVADLVIAGGYDAVTLFVAAGFEALSATSASCPQPFCTSRDGLNLGDGAAILALARAAKSTSLTTFGVRGFGASADAHHPTAPEPTGAGLRLAAERALMDAGVLAGDIRCVSAHGTATIYNDAAEMEVFKSLNFGAAAIHPFKGVIGHTLGAAGALETLALCDAAERQLLPAAAATRGIEPELVGHLLTTNERGDPMPALKLSAAFGGSNAALVLGRLQQLEGRRPVPVRVLAVGGPRTVLEIELICAAGARVSRDRILRIDELSSLCLSAVADVLSQGHGVPNSTDCGVVVGTATATIDANAEFDARRRQRGAARVEPRRFPSTSPNLAAGNVATVFGWHGPAVAVGGGVAASVEALLVAHDLVASGDATCCWCIAAEVAGEAATSIWQSSGWPSPVRGSLAVLLGRSDSSGAGRLERPMIQEAIDAVEAENGALLDFEPGWPVLRASINTACIHD